MYKLFKCLICSEGLVKVHPKEKEWHCPKCGADWAFVHFFVPEEWGKPGKKK